MTAGTIVLTEIAAKSDRTDEDLDRKGDYAPTIAYFLPGAILALLLGIFAKFFIK
jgi:hypothetical protein